MATEKEVAAMRAEIAKLTGRVCLSRDPVYIKRKLTELREAKRNKQDTRRRPAVGQHIMTVSMHPDQRPAVEDFADRMKIGNSALVRLALRELAHRYGYSDIAKKLEDDRG